MSNSPAESRQTSSPPRVVAISGIIFSALYITSLVLVRLAVPADPKDPGIWLADPAYRNWVSIALNLVPFTGIAFLWFMAVLRNRIGLLEDRFFATVFLGSGLLFVAMLFAAVAVSRGLLETFAAAGQPLRRQRNVCRRSGDGLRADEHLRHENGGHLHVCNVHDRASHGSPRPLGIAGGLRAWLDTAVGHHQLCLDRTGRPVLGAAGEHVYPRCRLPTRRPDGSARRNVGTGQWGGGKL